MNTPLLHPDNSTATQPLDVLAIFKEFWKLVIGVGILFLAAVTLYISTSNTNYQASVLLELSYQKSTGEFQPKLITELLTMPAIYHLPVLASCRASNPRQQDHANQLVQASSPVGSSNALLISTVSDSPLAAEQCLSAVVTYLKEQFDIQFGYLQKNVAALLSQKKDELVKLQVLPLQHTPPQAWDMPNATLNLTKSVLLINEINALETKMLDLGKFHLYSPVENSAVPLPNQHTKTLVAALLIGLAIGMFVAIGLTLLRGFRK